jgi:hypothetical protein
VVSGGGDGGGIDLERDVEERNCEGLLKKHLKLLGGRYWTTITKEPKY